MESECMNSDSWLHKSREPSPAEAETGFQPSEVFVIRETKLLIQSNGSFEETVIIYAAGPGRNASLSMSASHGKLLVKL